MVSAEYVCRNLPWIHFVNIEFGLGFFNLSTLETPESSQTYFMKRRGPYSHAVTLMFALES